MRRALPALLAIAGLSVFAGCGGSEVDYTEVSSPPAAYAIPADAGGAVATRTATPSTSATPTPTAAAGTTSSGAPAATTAPSTGTSTGTSGTTGGTTGGAAPTATSTPAQNTGGASPDQGLDQFCKDNPGACTGTNGN